MLAPTLRERETVRAEAEYADLYRDMADAIFSLDPCRVISAPGWNRGVGVVFDLVYDEMAGVDSDWMRCAVTRIIGMAATQKDNGPLQELAMKVTTRLAEAHARTRSGL